MTDLRTEFICKLLEVMPRAEAQLACNALDCVLNNYEVKPKSYELSVQSVPIANETTIKNFLGVKKLQGCSDDTIKLILLNSIKNY